MFQLKRNGECKMYYFYGATRISLTQEAHCEVSLNAAWQWQANAIDDEGNDYIVKWEQYQDFNGEDAGDACDWDNPIYVTKL